MRIHALENGLHGTVETLDYQGGTPTAVIGTNKTGGFAQLSGPEHIPSIYLGHDQDQQISGVLAKQDNGSVMVMESPDGGQLIWGTLFRWKAFPPAETEAEDETEEAADELDAKEDDEPAGEESQGGSDEDDQQPGPVGRATSTPEV